MIRKTPVGSRSAVTRKQKRISDDDFDKPNKVPIELFAEDPLSALPKLGTTRTLVISKEIATEEV